MECAQYDRKSLIAIGQVRHDCRATSASGASGAGLSQRALSAKVEIAQSAIADIERGAHDTRVGSLERLVSGCGGRLFVLPTSSSSAADWADHIDRILQGAEGETSAFRALIGFSDDLVTANPALRVALCVTPPAPTGDVRFDAGIAAVVEHHLAKVTFRCPSG